MRIPTTTLIDLTKGNSSFSEAQPGVQLAVDSTSLGDYKHCPTFYFYSIVWGLGSLGGNVHFEFGIFMHKAVETFHQARAQGASHDDALDATLDWLLRATWNPRLGRPWISDHRVKNRATLVRSVVWYFDRFREQADVLETISLANGKAAVELSFRFDSGIRIGGEEVLFCGHLDRLARLGTEVVIPDVKTTSRILDDQYFAQYTPHNQFSMYSLAGRVAFNISARMIVVDALRIEVNGTSFMRKPVERSDRVVEEWHEDAQQWVARMAQSAQDGHWPQNDKACVGPYGRCEYMELCSRNPMARESWAKGAFRRRQWDPLKVRGDI